MGRLCKTKRLNSIIVLVMVIGILVGCNMEPAHATQLSCRQFALALQLDHSASVFHIPVSPLNHALASSEESSSWVPRVVIPVVAVAVIGTTTYLIFSQRG